MTEVTTKIDELKLWLMIDLFLLFFQDKNILLYLTLQNIYHSKNNSQFIKYLFSFCGGSQSGTTIN